MAQYGLFLKRRHLLKAGVFSSFLGSMAACDQQNQSPSRASKEHPNLVKAQERKAKSEQRLKQMGVSINPHLPVLNPNWTEPKTPVQNIAKRLVVMRHLAGAATVNINAKKLVAWFKSQKLYGTLSDEELEFLQDCLDSKACQTNEDLSWRYEAAWFLAWTLGLMPTLKPPFEQVAQDGAPVWAKIPFGFDNEPCAMFIAKAQLIDSNAILDELDFTYRAYWATQNARIDSSTKVGSLDREVLMERSRAGNWMVRNDPNWDDVETST